MDACVLVSVPNAAQHGYLCEQSPYFLLMTCIVGWCVDTNSRGRDLVPLLSDLLLSDSRSGQTLSPLMFTFH
jgi:hypothetical protein